MDITTLIRADIASMEAYTPILPFEILSARLGRDRAVPWEPGATQEVAFELNGIGHVFPPGHRIRDQACRAASERYRAGCPRSSLPAP